MHILLLVVGTLNAQSTFYVYRAESTTSQYIWHLQNVNAANEAGVLSYLHSEVIPRDMGSGWPPNCIRKFGIDVIMRFEVTVKNPGGYPTPPRGAFVAFDVGECTVPGCKEKFLQDGYFIGQQDQGANPRHKYTGGTWFSFPYGGLCNSPDGTKNCTYIARPSAKLKIDDYVNSQGKVITPDYKAWCNAGNVEFERQSQGSCTVTRSIPFWNGICDATACANRVTQLKSTAGNMWNTTLENGCNTVVNSQNVFRMGTTCVAQCPSGYFPNWKFVCTPCAVTNCQTCTWPTSPDNTGGVCNMCKTGSYWENGTRASCVTQCPSHNYPNEGTQTCTVCNEACGNCKGPLANQCTSCPRPEQYLIISEGTCTNTCPAHTFPRIPQRECVACAATCSSCQGTLDSECTSCYSTHPFLDRGSCVSVCPLGRYADNNNNCLPCLNNCNTCQGAAAWCTSCDPTSTHPYLFPPNSTCLSSCPSHFFANTTTSISASTCQPCASVCSECSGHTDHECTMCGMDLLLSPFSPPAPSSSSSSLSLIGDGSSDGTHRYLENDTCVSECTPGSYPDTQRVCKPCNMTCVRCSEENTCTQCHDPEVVYDGHCVSACPSGLTVQGGVCTLPDNSPDRGLAVGLSLGGLFLLLILIVVIVRRQRQKQKMIKSLQTTPLLERA